MREDSAAKLRRLLSEAQARIRELESLEPVTVEVIKEIRVEVPGADRIIYQDNPDHIATIRRLQEQLCLYFSQSDS
jgi:hypothetical protein